MMEMFWLINLTTVFRKYGCVGGGGEDQCRAIVQKDEIHLKKKNDNQIIIMVLNSFTNKMALLPT